MGAHASKVVTRGCHIVVLTTDFKPMTGGVSEYLHRLWDQVACHVPVTVLTPVDAGGCTWPSAYRLERLPPLPERRLARRQGDSLVPIRKLNTARYFCALESYARRMVARLPRQPDIPTAVFVGIWDTASHFWCRALQRAGVRYGLHLYGLEVAHPLYGRLPHWREQDLRGAATLLPVSAATGAMVSERFGKDLQLDVVHPGVGPLPGLETVSRAAIRMRAALALPSGPTILTVARLVRRKGVDLVLACLPELARSFPDVTYVVAGDGPERSHLQRLAGDLGVAGRVRFPGAVDDAAKWGLYNLCDVFVLPNRLLKGYDWEGFGIVFLEAALMGRPVVGGRNGGVPDAVEDGRTGLLIDPESPGELVVALRRLLGDAELRRRMGAAAARRAREHFAWERIAEEFVARLGLVGKMRAGAADGCNRSFMNRLS